MVGEYDYTDANDGQESITPSSWTSHPDYNSGTTDYDFAIIKLSSDLTFSSTVMPACLPDSSTNYDAVSAVVTGWGTTSSGGSISATLKQVTVPFVSDDECDSNYSAYGGVDDETMICAGEEGVDSCQGDSGGPMTAYGVHVGIVSWGVGCARRGYPGVYGQTDAFISWINDNTAG